MTIQIFATAPSHWHIFLPASTSFSALCSLIHNYVLDLDMIVHELHIYVGMGTYINGLEIVENYEILLEFTPINCVNIVLDNVSTQMEIVDSTIQFMREVFDYNVCLTIVDTELLYHPSDDEI